MKELRSILNKDSVKSVQQLSNEWFDRADVDKSKNLECAEFIELMGSVGLPLSESEGKNLFSSFPQKNEGEVSYHEFVAAMRGDMPEFAASLAFMDQYRGHYPSAMSNVQMDTPRFDKEETEEWMESMHAVIEHHGPTRTRFLFWMRLCVRASRSRLRLRRPCATRSPRVRSPPTRVTWPLSGASPT